MYCKKCGKEIADEAAFCQACGEPVYIETAPAQPLQPAQQQQPAAQGKVNGLAIAGFCIFFGASFLSSTFSLISRLAGGIVQLIVALTGLAISIAGVALKNKKGYAKCNVLGILGIVFNSLAILSGITDMILFKVVSDMAGMAVLAWILSLL